MSDWPSFTFVRFDTILESVENSDNVSCRMSIFTATQETGQYIQVWSQRLFADWWTIKVLYGTFPLICGHLTNPMPARLYSLFHPRCKRTKFRTSHPFTVYFLQLQLPLISLHYCLPLIVLLRTRDITPNTGETYNNFEVTHNSGTQELGTRTSIFWCTHSNCTVQAFSRRCDLKWVLFHFGEIYGWWMIANTPAVATIFHTSVQSPIETLKISALCQIWQDTSTLCIPHTACSAQLQGVVDPRLPQ